MFGDLHAGDLVAKRGSEELRSGETVKFTSVGASMHSFGALQLAPRNAATSTIKNAGWSSGTVATLSRSSS